MLFSDEEVNEIVTAICDGMLPKTWATRRKHVADLKERFESTTVCPKCGGALMMRAARSGPRPVRGFTAARSFPAVGSRGRSALHLEIIPFSSIKSARTATIRSIEKLFSP